MQLICSNLTVCFYGRDRPVAALRDVSFTIGEGEFVSIIGPSGCGKTTLLRCLAGLESGHSGQIRYEHGGTGGRPRVLMVFQEHGVLPWLTALDNAALGLEAQGVPKRRRRELAGRLLARMGLGGRENAYPHQLSMGMRQRVAVARSFLCSPDVLLMDEPFAALDAQTRLRLQNELLGLWQDRRCSVVFVTHDVDEAILLSDRVIVLSAAPGTVIAEHRVPLPRPRKAEMMVSEPFTALKTALYFQLGLQTHERGRAAEPMEISP